MSKLQINGLYVLVVAMIGSTLGSWITRQDFRAKNYVFPKTEWGAQTNYPMHAGGDARNVNMFPKPYEMSREEWRKHIGSTAK